MAVVGIDLGTTYSAVAKLNELGKSEILPNDLEGENITPSVVFFDSEEEIVVGRAAKHSLELAPEQGVQFVKNDMGSAKTWKIFGTTYTPAKISGLILKKVKEYAEAHLDQKVTAAVITVPAIFGETERQATVEAAKNAGLEVLSIIDEPVAAALSYGLGKQDSIQDTQNILVYDLGGGTLDITVMRVTENRLTVLGTNGDRLLGGKQWDDALINYVADCFQQEYGSNPLDNPETLQDLRSRVEDAKKRLSQQDKDAVICTHDGKKKRVEITRTKFEELTTVLLERTKATTELVIYELVEAGKLQGWSDIHQVLLVGGSSRMPQVQKMMEQLSGQKPKLYEPDLAVAKGAALYAVMKLVIESERTGDKSRLENNGIDTTTLPKVPVVESACSFALGIKCTDASTKQEVNSVIIKKNTQLPAKVTQSYRTADDNQTSVRIVVFEGDSPNPEACKTLGYGVIRGIPPDLPKGSPIEVTLELNDESLLQVTAVETTYGRELTFQLDRGKLTS